MELNNSFLADYLANVNGPHWYVSGPMTTGRRYFERLMIVGHVSPQEHAELRCANEAQITKLANQVRRSFRHIRVLSPAEITEPFGMTQLEFHQFWMRVIDLAVTTVVQCPGWEYSTGSIWELCAALNKGCAVLDSSFQARTTDQLIASLREASSTVDSSSWKSAHDSALDLLL